MDKTFWRRSSSRRGGGSALIPQHSVLKPGDQMIKIRCPFDFTQGRLQSEVGKKERDADGK